MPTVINTNLASLFAQNSLTNAQNNLAQSVQRLSSGLRINSAKDDAAGLAIAQLMQSNINGVNQSIRNLSNATNLIQTADTSLATIQDVLLRMKQLSVQGYDGSLSAAQMVNVRTEISDLRDEINSTASRTVFNNINLLSGNRGVDASLGDVSKNQLLITTAVGDNGGSVGDASSPTNYSFGTASDFDLSWEASAPVNSDLYQLLQGDYELHSAEGSGVLTLARVDTATGDWLDSQSLSIADFEGSNSGTTTSSRTVNFDKFGLQLNFTTNVAQGETGSGAQIAFALTGETISIDGQSARITNIDIGDAGSGLYTFSQSANSELTLTHVYTDDLGNDITNEQTITLADESFGKGETAKINFGQLGISLEIYNHQLNTADEIADAIIALENVTDGSGDTGQLYITGGGESTLKFQSGPDSSSFIAIKTLNINTESGSSDTSIKGLGSAINALETLSTGSDISAWQSAYSDLDTYITGALNYISQERAVYGSQMNRLGYLSTNLTAQSTNLQASRSSIIDTDFAAETAKLTRGQIMQQAATAMLAQANQMPNVVLSLLK